MAWWTGWQRNSCLLGGDQVSFGDALRLRTTIGPVEQLDRVHHRQLCSRSDLGDAADIACGNDLRAGGLDVFHLSVAQLLRNLRLQYVVGAGRAAAQMSLA